MTGRTKLSIATLAAGLSLTTGVAAASEAQAQPAAASAPASVDSCLEASVDDQGWSDIITVTNYCSSSVRAKIVLDYAFDHCVTVPPEGARYRTNYPARFNRLDEC
jgi:hypothetical protein